MNGKGNIDMSSSGASNRLTVGIAQISPVWLNLERTLDKIQEYVYSAAQEGCQLKEKCNEP